jgi:alpha-L-rhamnosidase
MKLTIGLLLSLSCVPTLPATDSSLISRAWKAQWMAVPGASPFDYGVYHFRRTFALANKPGSFVVHVSADNRYQLFVNGQRAAQGPARGDLYHWRYETIDIAPYLAQGKNVLAAVVWNFADQAPLAQITSRTAFLVQGDTPAEQVVDTPKLWKGVHDEAYQPVPVHLAAYYAAGAGERVDAALYPWGWEQADYDDAKWQEAQPCEQGAGRDSSDAPSPWMLVPRSIPMEELTTQRLTRVRQSSGVTVPAGFPQQPAPVQVPARTKAKILLDQNWLTTGYPELLVSGGKGAVITLRYAEALWVPAKVDKLWAPGGIVKTNRDEVEGKQFVGYSDVFIADGNAERLFRPLWWRTWRYIELNVETKDEALSIDDLRGVYTGYPFERKARFDAGSAELQKILDVGWRTARLCAHETYMDCPYYEQLQYAGDTRIQALVSLYMTGDGRLMRNAIELLDSSRTAEGATYSRAPSRLQQYIPPFCLWWIGMVHDYWMYQDDPAFVKQMLPGVQAVLSFYSRYQKANASLGPMPWWNFTDWIDKWEEGVAPAGPDGASALLDLPLLMAYKEAAEMEAALGSKALAGEYRTAGARLQETAQRLYWDDSRKLYADDPQKSEFSQHANALAVLAGLIKGSDAHDFITRVAGDQSLVQCTIYFRYYLHAAMTAAGAGDQYIEMLGPWRRMLASGLTTWAERNDPSRSDCHAWGASPNIELFRTVLGIDSAAPGFRRVVIRPNLGKLQQASGSIPHPKGTVRVNLARREGKLEAEINLPEGVEGEFVWDGQSHSLSAGKSNLSLPFSK